MTEFEERIYEAVRRIPRGKVASYGVVARLAGYPGASRAVGNALHHNPDPDGTPCYRVVNSEGRLATNFGFGGIDTQKRMLEADGIDAAGYYVDMKRYGWTGESDGACRCTVYYADADALMNTVRYTAYRERLPLFRRQKADGYARECDRRLSVAVWALLQSVLAVRGISASAQEFAVGAHGKPYLKRTGNPISFSLTHAGHYVAVAVSNAEVGVDLEPIAARDPALARRFFHPEEQRLLLGYGGAQFDRIFTEIWTKKEAFVKATGRGFCVAPESFSVGGDTAADGRRLFTFDIVADAVLAVCTDADAVSVVQWNL